MFDIQFDTSDMIKHLDDVGKRQLPFATMQALNQTMFEVYDGWGEEIDKVFDRPVPFTRKAVRYKKATRDRLEAQVYLRDEATKGTPPARYTFHHTVGGARKAKPYERDLRSAGVLSENEYTVPGRGFPLDAYGNIPKRVINRILSDLQASKDALRRSTRESRRKRSRRRKIGQRAVYFYWPGDQGQGRNTHSLPRGIYERVDTRFGSAVRLALAIVQDTPTYSVRFDAEAIARKIFHERFPQNFAAHLKRALESARR